VVTIREVNISLGVIRAVTNKQKAGNTNLINRPLKKTWLYLPVTPLNDGAP